MKKKGRSGRGCKSNGRKYCRKRKDAISKEKTRAVMKILGKWKGDGGA